jgi:hypothetical protein
MVIATAIAIALVLIASNCRALERCRQYAHDVNRYHAQYFGLGFPSGYSVAQLEAESLCRKDIRSSDGMGSQGLAQITFRVWRNRLAKEGITEISTIGNHLRAQAVINHDGFKQAACKNLWVMYQITNGGPLVNKEIARAGSCGQAEARKECRRHDVVFKDGSRRSACDINYEYPARIHRLGSTLYGAADGGGFVFW